MAVETFLFILAFGGVEEVLAYLYLGMLGLLLWTWMGRLTGIRFWVLLVGLVVFCFGGFCGGIGCEGVLEKAFRFCAFHVSVAGFFVGFERTLVFVEF